MRGAFIKELVELAGRDERIVLLTGDLGYMALEPFAEKFPKRFFNVGVAEQNMVGVATGLAESGFIPFVYSIATFASLRPYEFIRNGPILHKLPVRIVGVGGGVEYGNNGTTHFGVEDVGVMRIQPGISLFAPADFEQTRTVLRATWNLPGPVYYRLGKDDKNAVPGLNGRFELGRAQVLSEGKDVLLVSMGSMAFEVLEAARMLEAQGIRSKVMVVASLNPAPTEDLAAALSQTKLAVTVEAHYECGGVGSLVCEIVAERTLKCRVIRKAIRETPIGVAGSQKHLYNLFGISREAIVSSVVSALK